MKLIAELKRLTNIKAGQWQTVLSDLSNEDFKLIVEHEVLPLIGAQYPLVKLQQIYVTGNPFVFTAEIPEWISRVEPANVISPSTTLKMLDPYHLSRIAGDVAKPTFLWEYAKPKLFLEYTGKLEIKGCHKPLLVDDGSNDWDITLLDEVIIPILIRLATGHAMIALGSDERKARLTELDLQFDGSEMITEGNEMVKEATEELERKNKWWLGAG